MVEQEDRDLGSLVVRRVGSLAETGDPWEPYRLLDSAGAPVMAVAAYFGELQAAGRSAATQRSYGMDLLRWFRFLLCTWQVHLNPVEPAGRSWHARDVDRSLAPWVLTWEEVDPNHHSFDAASASDVVWKLAPASAVPPPRPAKGTGDRQVIDWVHEAGDAWADSSGNGPPLTMVSPISLSCRESDRSRFPQSYTNEGNQGTELVLKQTAT